MQRTSVAKNSLVLMVSIDVMLIEIYRELFEAENCTMIDVAKLEKALKLMKEKKPCMVILDLAVPKENLLSLLVTKKKYQSTRNIPVVVLSHLSSPELVKESREQGVFLYSLKLHSSPRRIVSRVMAHI